MDRKTVGLLATGAATLLCGCPGLVICLSGAIFALAPGTFETTGFDGITRTGDLPGWVGYFTLCVGILMIAIPVVVGFFTLRQRAEEEVL